VDPQKNQEQNDEVTNLKIGSGLQDLLFKALESPVWYEWHRLPTQKLRHNPC
jgi:hypothetical protein